MYREHSIGVVVPTYNEVDHIGTVIETMPTFVDRIYVVDDASTDGTWREIQQHVTEKAAAALVGGTDEVETESARRLVPIRHEINRGVGGAIKTGYLRSLEDDLDIVAVMAGDGQMDPDYLPALLDPIVDDEADYTKGNRLLFPEHRSEMPRFRLLGNSILTLLTRIASGYWRIGDPQNGYTAIDRDALEAIEVADLFEFYGYCNELLVRLSVADGRVVDVPIPASYGNESSDIRYSEYIPRVSTMLLRSYLWRISRTALLPRPRPVGIFLLTALAGFITALGQFMVDAADVDSRNDTRSLVSFACGVLALVATFVMDARDHDDLQHTRSRENEKEVTQ
jgi:glycosyltransferase involved in cell wall biosynthesis